MSHHHGTTRALAHAIEKRSVVDDVPLALRTYTTGDLGGNHTDLRRWTDGPEALPTGPKRVVLPSANGVHLGEDDVMEFYRAQELYRTRTQSHLFDEWMVDLVLDLSYTQARAAGRMLADCHRCHITLMVTEDADACTYCGTEF